MTTPATESAPKPAGPPPSLHVTPLPASGGVRVFIFYSSALLLTGIVSMIFADLLWRTGWSASRTFLLILFVLLFLFSAIGSMTGVYGFLVRILGDRGRLTRLSNYRDQSIGGTSTAIVCPIYNEDVV